MNWSDFFIGFGAGVVAGVLGFLVYLLFVMSSASRGRDEFDDK